jgi:hypothetical protein
MAIERVLVIQSTAGNRVGQGLPESPIGGPSAELYQDLQAFFRSSKNASLSQPGV